MRKEGTGLMRQSDKRELVAKRRHGDWLGEHAGEFQA